MNKLELNKLKEKQNGDNENQTLRYTMKTAVDDQNRNLM